MNGTDRQSTWRGGGLLLVLMLLLLNSGLRTYAQTPITCTVRVAKLNLRAMPNTRAQILIVLSAEERVSVDARTQSGGRRWLRATVRNQQGWVDAALVKGCTPTTLPLVQPPTAPSNATQSPLPQPTPAPFVVSYTPAPNAGGVDGTSLLIPRDARPGADGIPRFGDYVIVQLDPQARAAENGTAVAQVEFRIEADDNSDDLLYSHTESNAPYCLFSNNTDVCENIWVLAQTGGRWPQAGGDGMRPSNRRVDPTKIYHAKIRADYQDETSDFWDFRFRIVPPGTPAGLIYLTPAADSFTPDGLYSGEVRVQSDLVTALDALIHYEDRMTLQLVVHNGSGADGDGVGSVTFTIKERASDQLVYQHTERSQPYCLFGDSGALCNTVWRLADSDFAWPASDPESGISEGQPVLFDNEYSATMTATDPDGNFVGEWTVYFDFTR